MPSGTTIRLFVPRVHKSSAADAAENSDDLIRYLEDKITALVSLPKTPSADLSAEDIADQVVFALKQIFHDYKEAAVAGFTARFIAENPGDCVDELEESDHPCDEELLRSLLSYAMANKAPLLGLSSTRYTGIPEFKDGLRTRLRMKQKKDEGVIPWA